MVLSSCDIIPMYTNVIVAARVAIVATSVNSEHSSHRKSTGNRTSQRDSKSKSTSDKNRTSNY